MTDKPYTNDTTYLQNDNKNLFEIFSYNTDIDWSTASILDFGCNQGNFLSSAEKFIQENNYIGIDLNQNSINAARLKFPRHNFIHYNKWHRSYNPSGHKDLLADSFLNKKFDVIILYSVFTHLTIAEAVNELEILKKILNPNGKILFTIWDEIVAPYFLQYIAKTYSNQVNYLLPKYNFVCYTLNYNTFIIDQTDIELQQCTSVCTFYKINNFQKTFPETKIVGFWNEMKINNNFQTLVMYEKKE